jgi:hypothetical protein
MDDTKKMRKYTHLQLGFAKFDTIVCERDLKELVLSNQYDMVALSWVEFTCGVRRFCRVARGMEAIQNPSVKVATNS